MGARRVIQVRSISKEGVVRPSMAVLACLWCNQEHVIDADQLVEAAEDFPYEVECVCGGRLVVFPADRVAGSQHSSHRVLC